MSSKIAKVTVLIIAVALILVEVAPRWQLRAANDEDLTTTEISVDNGTGDDPDNAPEQEKPAVTPKPAQTAAPAKRESAKPKADDSGKGKAADAGKSQVAKNRNGEALDKVRCRFDGEHQTFTRIEPRPEPMPAKKARQKPRQVSFWGDGSDWQQMPDGERTPFDEAPKETPKA